MENYDDFDQLLLLLPEALVLMCYVKKVFSKICKILRKTATSVFLVKESCMPKAKTVVYLRILLNF